MFASPSRLSKVPNQTELSLLSVHRMRRLWKIVAGCKFNYLGPIFSTAFALTESKYVFQGNLLFCCDCQNAFHANCHGPSASSSSNSNSPWVCKRCLGERSPVKQSRSQEKQPIVDHPESEDNADDEEAHQEFAGFSDNEIRKDSFSLSDSAPVNDSVIQPDEDDDDDDDEEEADEDPDQDNTVEDLEENDVVKEEEKFDPRLDNFEDIQNWSCDDVYQYFKHYFPDYAHLFKEQVK